MNQYPTYEQGLHYNDLYEDHKNWLNELDFSKSEIAFFQHSLEDFAGVHKTPESRSLIEQFQNKLILHGEQIDLMLHDLKQEREKLSEFIKTHEKNIEFITFSDHKVWRDKMNTHRKLYNEMKQELYRGLTQNK